MWAKEQANQKSTNLKTLSTFFSERHGTMLTYADEVPVAIWLVQWNRILIDTQLVRRY